MYNEFMKKKVFVLLTLAAASQAHRSHGRQKVSIPERATSSVPASKVSCCVEPSWSSKNSDFDAIVSLPLAPPF